MEIRLQFKFLSFLVLAYLQVTCSQQDDHPADPLLAALSKEVRFCASSTRKLAHSVSAVVSAETQVEVRSSRKKPHPEDVLLNLGVGSILVNTCFATHQRGNLLVQIAGLVAGCRYLVELSIHVGGTVLFWHSEKLMPTNPDIKDATITFPIPGMSPGSFGFSFTVTDGFYVHNWDDDSIDVEVDEPEQIANNSFRFQWIHPQKTGTSFAHALYALTCPEFKRFTLNPQRVPELCRSRWAFAKRELTGRKFRPSFLISEHYHWFPSVPSQSTFITLRSPANRLRSWAEFYINHFIRANGVLDACESLSKLQSGELGGEGHGNGLEFTHDMENYTYRAMLTGSLSNGSVSLACERVHNSAWVGLTDYFNASICLLHALFPHAPHPKQLRNHRPTRPRGFGTCPEVWTTLPWPHMESETQIYLCGVRKFVADIAELAPHCAQHIHRISPYEPPAASELLSALTSTSAPLHVKQPDTEDTPGTVAEDTPGTAKRERWDGAEAVERSCFSDNTTDLLRHRERARAQAEELASIDAWYAAERARLEEQLQRLSLRYAARKQVAKARMSAAERERADQLLDLPAARESNPELAAAFVGSEGLQGDSCCIGLGCHTPVIASKHKT